MTTEAASLIGGAQCRWAGQTYMYIYSYIYFEFGNPGLILNVQLFKCFRRRVISKANLSQNSGGILASNVLSCAQYEAAQRE